MPRTSEQAKKDAEKKLAADPSHYSKIALKAKKPRGGKASPGSFKTGNKFGKIGKRGKAKVNTEIKYHTLEEYKLEFEEQ